MERVWIFALLAIVLSATYGSHASGLFWAVGGVGTHAGWSFPFTLALIFAAALASAILPRWRFQIVLGSSLLHLFVIYRPFRAGVALAIWVGFYLLVRLRVSWWIKSVPVLALYAAPFLFHTFDPASALVGALTVAFCATNFTLRSFLYAYEAGTHREPIEKAGLAGYLLCMAAAPLMLVNFAPIGFLVLLRGLRKEADLPMLIRGVREIALGAAFLTALHAGTRIGVLPQYGNLIAAADGMNLLTTFTACHLLLLRFFLKVAGDIHLAVGMLRVLGFDIAPGSERPYLSPNILEFWRRWNTYYRDYLLKLGYYPAAAALKRRPILAVVAGGAGAFLLSGLAHVLQYLIRHPGQLSIQLILEAHAWALVFGACVVAWMIRDVRRPGLTRARIALPPEAPLHVRLRHAGAVAVTLSAASLILLLYYPPLTGSPLSTLGGIVRSLLRLPT